MAQIAEIADDLSRAEINGTRLGALGRPERYSCLGASSTDVQTASSLVQHNSGLEKRTEIVVAKYQWTSHTIILTFRGFVSRVERKAHWPFKGLFTSTTNNESTKAGETPEPKFQAPVPSIHQSLKLKHKSIILLLLGGKASFVVPEPHLRTATTTVSRFFTDKAGAVSTSEQNSAVEVNISPRKRPTLLQRLHIHTSAKRTQSPTPSPRAETAPNVSGFAEDYTASPIASKPNASLDSDDTLDEITRIMPQSLTVGGGPSSRSSIKRQRSADSREITTRTASGGHRGSDGSFSRLNVRIPSYLDKSKAEISQAFQDLEWKQRFRLFHALENPTTSPFRVDRSEIVISRNRYGNVQPWDNSRIKLKTPLGGSDYVNASPITLRSRGSTSRQNQGSGHASLDALQTYKYIATQGPKDEQAVHFWHMVMQESTGEVGVVVMLTQCYEANKEKCAQYFPADMEASTIVLPSEHDDLTEDQGGTELSSPLQDSVTLKTISQDVETGSQLRILNLSISGRTKTIYHYLYHGWPDFGKPEAEDRLALLQLIRQSRKIAGESPRIVHCSAGVGRTGTFIALDFLLQEIEEGRVPDTNLAAEPNPSTQDDSSPVLETWGKSGPPKVKTPTGGEFPSGEENTTLKDDLIYQIVNTLREQRMMMVMNELQYAFLYEVVREVFWEKYRVRPEGAVVKGAETGTRDLPKGKVAKIDDGTEAGSGSEAETEIIEGDEEAAKQEAVARTEAEGDPYDVVAPEHIREGVAKEQQ